LNSVIIVSNALFVFPTALSGKPMTGPACRSALL
jgi:hypothetical protein